jgi:hypothetical protein
MASQFSAVISDSDDELLKKPFEFLYGFPDTVQDLSQLTLTVPAEAVRSLWKRSALSLFPGSGYVAEIAPACSIDKNGTTENEAAQLLLEAMEGHFHHFFHINLASLKLLRLGTPVCHIGNDGRVKFFNRSKVHYVLKHLTFIAVRELAKVHS